MLNAATSTHDILEESYLFLKEALDKNSLHTIPRRSRFFAVYVFLLYWTKTPKTDTHQTACYEKIRTLNNHVNFKNIDKDLQWIIPMVGHESFEQPHDWKKISQPAKDTLTLYALNLLKNIAKQDGALFPEDRIKIYNYLIWKQMSETRRLSPLSPLSFSLALPNTDQTNTLKKSTDWLDLLAKPGKRIIVGGNGTGKTTLAKLLIRISYLQTPSRLIFIPLAELPNSPTPMSLGNILSFFSKLDNDAAYPLEQRLLDSYLLEKMQSPTQTDSIILLVDGYPGMGDTPSMTLKNLLALPKITLTSSPIDHKLLRNNKLLNSVDILPLIDLDETKIKTYIDCFFQTKNTPWMQKIGKDFWPYLEKNIYLRALVKTPETLELACLHFYLFGEIKSLPALYQAMPKIFLINARKRCLTENTLMSAEILVDDYSLLAYNWFKKGILQNSVPERYAHLTEIGLLVPISKEYQFVTHSMMACFAANYIAKKKKNVFTLPGTIHFAMLASVCRFLIHIWVNQNDYAAIENFFSQIIHCHKHSMHWKTYDYTFLLSLTRDEALLATALAASLSAESALVALPDELTRQIAYALSKKIEPSYDILPGWNLHHRAHDKALLAAAGKLNITELRTALYQGANINAVDKKGNSALHLVCKHSVEKEFLIINALNLLLKEGADYTLKNNHKETPFQCSSRAIQYVFMNFWQEQKISEEMMECATGKISFNTKLMSI